MAVTMPVTFLPSSVRITGVPLRPFCPVLPPVKTVRSAAVRPVTTMLLAVIARNVYSRFQIADEPSAPTASTGAAETCTPDEKPDVARGAVPASFVAVAVSQLPAESSLAGIVIVCSELPVTTCEPPTGWITGLPTPAVAIVLSGDSPTNVRPSKPFTSAGKRPRSSSMLSVTVSLSLVLLKNCTR